MSRCGRRGGSGSDGLSDCSDKEDEEEDREEIGWMGRSGAGGWRGTIQGEKSSVSECVGDHENKRTKGRGLRQGSKKHESSYNRWKLCYSDQKAQGRKKRNIKDANPVAARGSVANIKLTSTRRHDGCGLGFLGLQALCQELDSLCRPLRLRPVNKSGQSLKNQ